MPALCVYVYSCVRVLAYGCMWRACACSQAALKANRKLAYDDFIAVAEHLVATGVTTPARLGIRGGSNGGLLMGNALVCVRVCKCPQCVYVYVS